MNKSSMTAVNNIFLASFYVQKNAVENIYNKATNLNYVNEGRQSDVKLSLVRFITHP